LCKLVKAPGTPVRKIVPLSLCLGPRTWRHRLAILGLPGGEYHRMRQAFPGGSSSRNSAFAKRSRSRAMFHSCSLIQFHAPARAVHKDHPSRPPNPGIPRRTLLRQGRSKRLRMLIQSLLDNPSRNGTSYWFYCARGASTALGVRIRSFLRARSVSKEPKQVPLPSYFQACSFTLP